MLLLQAQGMNLFKQVKQWEITIPMILLFTCIFVGVIIAIILYERSKCPERILGKAKRHPALTRDDEDWIAMMDLERSTTETKPKYIVGHDPYRDHVESDPDLKAIATVERIEPIVEVLNKEEPQLSEAEKQLIAEYKQSMERTDFIIQDKE